MKNALIGFILGIAIILAFLYFGGSRYLKTFGMKTEEAGVKLEKYEKGVQETARTAKETAEKTYGKTKEKVKELLPPK